MSEAAWPRQNPEWRRLAGQAWAALDGLRTGERFSRSANSDGSLSAADDVDSAYACEAIAILEDQAPQWARGLDWLPAIAASLKDDAIRTSLKNTPAEVALPEEQIVALIAAVEAQVGCSPIQVQAPSAVSGYVAARSRLALLPVSKPSDFRDAELMDLGDELLATLVLQARVLAELHAQDSLCVHPRAFFEVARALWLATIVLDSGRAEYSALDSALENIPPVIQDLTERLLTRSRLGRARDGETVALVYCGAILALPKAPDPSYAIEALMGAAAGQSERGDWPQGRVIEHDARPEDTQRLVVSSHEVAAVLGEALFWLGLTPHPGIPLPPELSLALRRAIQYMADVSVAFGSSGLRGWATDQIYGVPAVETRATAAALRLVVITRSVAEHERQASALQEFEDVWDPQDYTPDYLIWPNYIKRNEPDAANAILPYLDEQYVSAAAKRKREDRRPWARTQAMSLILFGPPGTTKTTIVKAMAQGLDWPLVTVSPGTFIRDGLEQVERRAIEVFARLQDLARAVVLFDECDELFRARRRVRREDAGTEETRSISAFVTASMLPKLQDLRDQGQILFIIATNYFDQIDSAAKRVGRIDRVVGVSWPDEAQRANMIRHGLREHLDSAVIESALVDDAVRRLAEKSRFYVRGELIELASTLARRVSDISSSADARTVVDEILENQQPSIDKEDVEHFREDATKRSAPHRAGQGELKPGNP